MHSNKKLYPVVYVLQLYCTGHHLVHMICIWLFRGFCLSWFTDDFDELVVSNSDVVLRNIAEDLRNRLPIEAMFTSEHQAVQKVS